MPFALSSCNLLKSLEQVEKNLEVVYYMAVYPPTEEKVAVEEANKSDMQKEMDKALTKFQKVRYKHASVTMRLHRFNDDIKNDVSEQYYGTIENAAQKYSFEPSTFNDSNYFAFNAYFVDSFHLEGAIDKFYCTKQAGATFTEYDVPGTEVYSHWVMNIDEGIKNDSWFSYSFNFNIDGNLNSVQIQRYEGALIQSTLNLTVIYNDSVE